MNACLMPRGLALAVAMAAAACQNPFASSRDAVASVNLSPPAASVEVGATVAFDATVRNAEGDRLHDRTVFWATDDSTVASVTESGIVTAHAPGTAHILATSEGQDDLATVVVMGERVATVLVVPDEAEIAEGETIELQALAYDASGEPLTGLPASWTSSNPAAAAVDADGRVTGVDRGEAIITAILDGRSGSATVKVRRDRSGGGGDDDDDNGGRGGGGGGGDDDDHDDDDDNDDR